MRPAAYAEPGRLTVRAAPGVGLDLPRLEAALRMELEPGVPLELTLVQSTVAPTIVQYTLRFEGGRTATRSLDLADVEPEARERVLALVLAEVARAAPPAPAPQRPAATVAPAVEPGWRPGASADLGLRAFLPGTLGLETALGGYVRHRSGVRLDLGVRYLHATRDTSLGSTMLDALLGSIRISYERRLSSRFTLRVGPRLDLGVALGRGRTNGPATELPSVTGPFGLLLAEAELRLRISQPVGLTLGLDGGGTLTGLELRADDETGVRARGGTLGVHVGASTN